MYDKSMGGIRQARTLIPMPQPQKFSADAIREVAATPWSLHETSKPGVIKFDDAAPGEARQERVPLARRLYIYDKDLKTHGYTKNCPKCQSIIVYGPNVQGTMNHSEECRKRIMEALASTPEGLARIARERARHSIHC